jgi:broad specificity phosphatase PhoE
MVRHSERADQVMGGGDSTFIENRNDPPLTSRGKEMAFDAGVAMRSVLLDCGVTHVKVESSPFLRCL